MDVKHCDVLIVGAGISGLTAAAYLAKNNHSVLLLEKNSDCGGLLNSFSRNGYVFDSGARSIENSGIIKPMLKDLGLELELLPSPVSIGIEETIIDLSKKTGIAEYEKLLKRLYPEQEQNIHRIFRKVSKIYKKMHIMYGFENPVFKNFRNDKKYLFTELLPWFGKFVLAVSLMQRMNDPIGKYLKKFTDNQSLIDIFAQHFFKQTPTFFALGYFYVYRDYLYPKGGTGSLREKIQQKILDDGGEIQVNTLITSIHPSKKIAEDSKGQIYSYKKLVWAADLKTLYNILDHSRLTIKQSEMIGIKAEKIKSARSSDSVFTLYLGVNQSPQAFSEITNGHLFYTPSKQGLGQTQLSELTNLLLDTTVIHKEEICEWIKKFCRLTTYEISIPSLRDPQLSPEGKTGMVISFLLDYLLFKAVSADGWYDEFKTCIEDQMIRTLDAALFPGLKNQIEMRFSSTPLSIEKMYGNYEGGITGWTFEEAPPVVDKLPKIPSSITTPIPDVYQCGQWAYSPAGIPTAILTGWYAADAIRTNLDGHK